MKTCGNKMRKLKRTNGEREREGGKLNSGWRKRRDSEARRKKGGRGGAVRFRIIFSYFSLNSKLNKDNLGFKLLSKIE